jgi:hypothetical protein
MFIYMSTFPWSLSIRKGQPTSGSQKAAPLAASRITAIPERSLLSVESTISRRVYGTKDTICSTPRECCTISCRYLSPGAACCNLVKHNTKV